MKILRILGILILVAGIACIFFSNYITNQVNEGKIKIEKGEQTVGQTNKLFSLSPYSKPIGDQLSSSGQKKIEAGKKDIAYYEQLTQTLRVSGIAAIIVGAGMTIGSFFGSRKKRR